MTVAEKLNPTEAFKALLDSHPGGFEIERNNMFEPENYQEILQGKALFHYQETVDEGLYLDRFFVTFNWWVNVAGLVVDEKAGDGGWDEVAEIFGPIDAICALYGTAFKARYITESIGRSDPTGLEMLRRYCVFRQTICKHLPRELRGIAGGRLEKLP